MKRNGITLSILNHRTMESILSNTAYLEPSDDGPEDAEDRELDADETTDHDMVEVSAPNDNEDAAKEEEAQKKVRFSMPMAS